MTSVWDSVIGQSEVVSQLSRAAADAAQIKAGRPGPSMTHAWLLTGPPGSGRSTAALMFAAALQCENLGCGHCASCSAVLGRVHSDVEAFTPETLQITAKESLELIHRASLHPVHGRWNVLIVEDADRLNEISGNALLKSIEEPNDHTVWVLCAPTPHDVLPTIVSRTRSVVLRTPSNEEVAAALVSLLGAEPAMASFAARAAQGHIGRARALAADEAVRMRRHQVLAIPMSLRGLGACFQAAANLIEAATADASAITDAQDGAELASLMRAFGDGDTGLAAVKVRRASGAAVKDMEARQKSRRTRTVRDQLDRALLDLIGFYRDVLVLQVKAPVGLINEELKADVNVLAMHSTPVQTQVRIAAVEHARLAIGASVAPLLAMEAMTVQLAGLDRDPNPA